MPHREPKVWEPRPGDHSGSLFDAIVMAADVDAVRRFLRRNPGEHRRPPVSGATWVHAAARKGSLAIVDVLLEAGLTMAEVNAADAGNPGTLLETAARHHPGLVGPLLERGADPTLGRPLIAALNHEDEDQSLEAVRALVEAGADVNRVYDLYGNPEPGFTALEWASGKPTVAVYLRSAGAVDRPPPARATTGDPTDAVVAFCRQQFGPADARPLAEIVATTDPPVRVHVVRPNPKGDCVTLFTTGLSARAMAVPAGGEEYRYAEVFTQLPADWPLGLDDLSQPRHGWPAAWVRAVAGVPHAAATWLGGGSGTVATADPPEPFAPGLPFTVAWLIAERTFTRGDGQKVHLYRLVPLTTPEWELLLREGEAALGDALDAAGVGLAIDPGRRSVV